MVPLEPVLDARVEGTTVVALSPLGAAQEIGLAEGDELLEVQGRPVADAGELRAAWAAIEDHVHVVLRRGGERVTLDLPLPLEPRYDLDLAPWTAGGR